jgi:hypothetical protein
MGASRHNCHALAYPFILVCRKRPEAKDKFGIYLK